jgi:hypothetical protein
MEASEEATRSILAQCVMQMDVYKLEPFLPKWLRWTGMVQGADYSEEPAPGFHPGKRSAPLAGLCQVGGRSQDFVLRTASWAKVSRPSGAIAKQFQDRAGNIIAAICDQYTSAR